MALGVAAAWARQFEGIYEQGTGPAWFVGRHPMTGFSTRSFERSLSSAMSQTSEVMASSPRSQVSSGGVAFPVAAVLVAAVVPGSVPPVGHTLTIDRHLMQQPVDIGKR